MARHISKMRTTLCKNRLPKNAFFNVEAAVHEVEAAPTLEDDVSGNPLHVMSEASLQRIANIGEGMIW